MFDADHKPLSEQAARTIRLGTVITTSRLPYAVIACPQFNELRQRWEGGQNYCEHGRHASFHDAAECAAAHVERIRTHHAELPGHGYWNVEIIRPTTWHWKMSGKQTRSAEDDCGTGSSK